MSQRVFKQDLRRRHRAARLAMTDEEHRRSSAAVAAWLMTIDGLLGAERVASFWPMLERREIDLTSLHPTLAAQNKKLAYPFMAGTTLGFRYCADPSTMVRNRWGFSEPGPECESATDAELDAIIVPALALTPAGERLGYGAGFYDRVIARLEPRPLTIGCCYGAELLTELPTEPHDLTLDWVVTEHGAALKR